MYIYIYIHILCMRVLLIVVECYVTKLMTYSVYTIY